jgi:hypothetical protein
MKVRCKANKASDLSEEVRKLAQLQEGYAFPISVGEKYTVYAISIFWDILWYSICADSYVYHPAWIPAGFFQIEDSRISKYWTFAVGQNDGATAFILAFPEWAADENYYGELIDNWDDSVEIWNKYKTLIEEEADANT